MAELRLFGRRAAASVAATLAFAVPALAFQAHEGGGASGTFSAPEIEIALVSSAILVAAGAALILRDRKARRKLDKPE